MMFLYLRIELKKKKLCRQILKYGLQDETTQKTSVELDEMINRYNSRKIMK